MAKDYVLERRRKINEARAALEAAIELVGKVVTGQITQDASNTGVLACYREQFTSALQALK